MDIETREKIEQVRIKEGQLAERVREAEEAQARLDAEAWLLERLAKLKATVAGAADDAPDLPALRHLIGDMFSEVTLMTGYSFPAKPPTGFIPLESDVGLPPTIIGGDDDYWLLPALNWSSVGAETFKPIGQEIPVGSAPQYPPSNPNPFLSRYCWW